MFSFIVTGQTSIGKNRCYDWVFNGALVMKHKKYGKVKYSSTRLSVRYYGRYRLYGTTYGAGKAILQAIESAFVDGKAAIYINFDDLTLSGPALHE